MKVNFLAGAIGPEWERGGARRDEKNPAAGRIPEQTMDCEAILQRGRGILPRIFFAHVRALRVPDSPSRPPRITRSHGSDFCICAIGDIRGNRDPDVSAAAAAATSAEPTADSVYHFSKFQISQFSTPRQ
jgi:hypothetical protein